MFRRPDFRIKAPLYAGKRDDCTLKLFLSKFEKFCTHHEVENEEKLNYLGLTLEGAALEFFDNTKQRNNEITYDDMIECLKERFDETKIKLVIRSELNDRKKKPDETITDFYAELDKEAAKIELADAEILFLFINALPSEMKRYIALQAPATARIAYQMAKNYEQITTYAKPPDTQSIIDFLKQEKQQKSKDQATTSVVIPNTDKKEFREMKMEIANLQEKVDDFISAQKYINQNGSTDPCFDRFDQNHDFGDDNRWDHKSAAYRKESPPHSQPSITTYTDKQHDNQNSLNDYEFGNNTNGAFCSAFHTNNSDKEHIKHDSNHENVFRTNPRYNDNNNPNKKNTSPRSLRYKRQNFCCYSNMNNQHNRGQYTQNINSQNDKNSQNYNINYNRNRYQSQFNSGYNKYDDKSPFPNSRRRSFQHPTDYNSNRQFSPKMPGQDAHPNRYENYTNTPPTTRNNQRFHSHPDKASGAFGHTFHTSNHSDKTGYNSRYKQSQSTSRNNKYETTCHNFMHNSRREFFNVVMTKTVINNNFRQKRQVLTPESNPTQTINHITITTITKVQINIIILYRIHGGKPFNIRTTKIFRQIK